MKIDCHMHTPLCGHAVGAPMDYVASAARQGLELITFTCHCPMEDPRFGGARIRMAHDQLADYFALVEEARRYGETCGVQVLVGIEAEVFPISEVLAPMQACLQQHHFDFVLGSLHHQLPSYRDWLNSEGIRTDAAIIRDYFHHLTLGAQSGIYHSMSHPDVIRIYGTIDSEAFEPSAFEAEIRTFLKACASSGCCMEVNTSGLSKGVYEVHPDPIILDWAREEGVQLTLGSDAHHPNSVGQHFDQVLALLRAKGFDELNYFRSGKPTPIPIPPSSSLQD